jgi:Xaa-Pro aminopeptidase
VLSDLEIDRGRKLAKVDEVASFSSLARELGGTPPAAAVIAYFLRRRKIRRVEVPADFPLGLARVLEKAGIRTVPVAGHFWPDREIKTAREIAAVRAALKITNAGLRRADPSFAEPLSFGNLVDIDAEMAARTGPATPE